MKKELHIEKMNNQKNGVFILINFNNKLGLLLLLFFTIIGRVNAQVIYTQQTTEYDQSLTTSGTGGIYNNGTTEIGMWMDGDNAGNSYAGNVMWKNFRVGSATSNAQRSLQVGDEFTIQVYTRGVYYGTIGVSLNSGSIPTSTWANRTANRRIAIQQDGGNFGSGGGRGSWYYANGIASIPFSITPNSVAADYVLKFKITAPNKCNVTVNGTTLYDVDLGGTADAAITHYSIYMSDDRSLAFNDNGGGRGDVYWKQTTQVNNTGMLNLGSSNNSFTISNILTNGLNANSNSTVSNNKLVKAGTGNLTLNGANTYTGNTEIDNGELWIQSSGSIASGSAIYVGNGGQVTNTTKLFLASSVGGTTFSRDININPGNAGTRVIGGLNTSGTHTFSGSILRNSNQPLTVEVVNSGGTLVVSGVINGSGTVTKNGNGTLTLTNTNTYSGATNVSAGTLKVDKSAGYIATITTSGISVAFSPAPTRGTYQILPGALSSASTLSTSGLAAGQTASFNSSTGTLTVNDTPSVTLVSNDADNTFCLGTSVTFTATASNVGGGSVTYDFKVNGSTVQNTGSNFYTTSGLTGTPTVTVVVNITGGTFLTTNTATSNTISNTVQSSTVTVASIASSNSNPALAKNGDIITLSFTTSDNAASTPTVLINGNAATVSGSGTFWSATRTVSGDVNGVATFSISYQNTLGCTGTRSTVTNGSSVTVDTFAPTIPTASIFSNNANDSLAKVGDTITLNFITSETPAIAPSVTINGGAASVSGNGTLWSATKLVGGGDTNGVVTFSISINDATGNSASRTTTTDSSSVTIDTFAPTISTVTIASNNANASLAKVGDTITLNFTTSETPAIAPSVTINGGAASVSGSGTLWSATKLVAGGATNGVVTFSISISDATGNSASRTTTTDSSSVTIDTFAPTISSATIASSNANPALAGIGDVITLSFTTSETPASTPLVTIGGTLSFVSGSGTSWSASKTITNCSNGVVAFSISLSDASGNNASRTSTTDSSQVTITEINFNSADDNCDSSLFDGHAPVVVDVTTPSGALATMTSTITSSTATNTTPYSGASVTYKFKVTKTNAPTSVAFVSSNTTSFAFSSASNAAHSSTYDVQATAIVNGEEQPYNGNTTSYSTPAEPILSNPPTQAGPPNVACAYTLARIDSYIYANNSTTYGANRYEFLVERMDNGNAVQTVSVATTVPYFKLTNIAGIPATMQVTYATTYRISVRYGYGATSFGSQIYTAYGTPCLVSTPTLPVASIACGTRLASVNAFVYASGQAAGASQFEFKVTRVSTPQPGELPVGTVTEEIIPRNVANFKLTMLTQLFVGLQKEYSVAVRYTVTTYGSTNVSPWTPVPCSLFTPDFPETQIVAAQCGVEGVPSSINEYVYADNVPGATQYHFRLYQSDAPYSVEAPYQQDVYSPSNYVKLNQFPDLQAGVAYSVIVVPQLYGEYPNILLAKDCSVTAPQSTPPAVGPAKAAIASAFQATAYPNPFANNFMIAVKSGSQSAVDLKVYDMIGRLIESRKVALSDMGTATIGGQYPSGVYNVVISQEDNVQTLRVVKR